MSNKLNFAYSSFNKLFLKIEFIILSEPLEFYIQYIVLGHFMGLINLY